MTGLILVFFIVAKSGEIYGKTRSPGLKAANSLDDGSPDRPRSTRQNDGDQLELGGESYQRLEGNNETPVEPGLADLEPSLRVERATDPFIDDNSAIGPAVSHADVSALIDESRSSLNVSGHHDRESNRHPFKGDIGPESFLL